MFNSDTRYRHAGWFIAILSMISMHIASHSSSAESDHPASSQRTVVRQQNSPSKSQLIAELRSQIDADQSQADQLKKVLTASSQAESDFVKAETRFKALENDLKEIRNRIADLRSKEPADPEALASAVKESTELEAKRAEALSAFELEIDQIKILQEKIVTIEMKIDSGKAALDRLMNTGKTDRNSAAKNDSANFDENTLGSDASGGTQKLEANSSKAGKTVDSAAISKSMLTGDPTGLAGSTGKQTSSTSTSESVREKISGTFISRRIREQVRELQQIIEDSKNQLVDAEKDEELVAAMVANLERQVQLESKLRDNARKKADLANGKLSKAQEEFRVKSIADAPQEVLQDLAEKLLEMDKDFQTARDESRLHSNKLEDIQNERAETQAILQLAQQKRVELQKRIDDSEKQIAELKNPTSLLNMVDWLATRGVRIFLILLAMLGSRSALRSIGSRAIRMMVHSQEKVDKEDRNDRAETLVSVYSNAVSVSVIGGGLVLMAQEAGIPIGPLLGGVAIFGLAIAFGAQNLIKDYFYGFVVLLENQFSVNDVIQVGTVTGLVERITLRMTVIRDAAGTVHFVPNGSMTTVSNYSYDWSRAVFEIPVSYKAPIDEVIQQILIEGRALRQDKEFGPLCLDDLTMLGVDNMSENSVLIKFFIKTKPLKQWPVKREMLRRLINRFEELGIDLQVTTRVTTTTVRKDDSHEKGITGPNSVRESNDSFAWKS